MFERRAGAGSEGDRRALRTWNPSNGGNARIVRDESMVERARAGDVLLLKGERYPTERPVVHRSPPIEATGETRLVLSTYDPAP